MLGFVFVVGCHRLQPPPTATARAAPAAPVGTTGAGTAPPAEPAPDFDLKAVQATARENVALMEQRFVGRWFRWKGVVMSIQRNEATVAFPIPGENGMLAAVQFDDLPSVRKGEAVIEGTFDGIESRATHPLRFSRAVVVSAKPAP